MRSVLAAASRARDSVATRVLFAFAFVAIQAAPVNAAEKSLSVTATAYNSVEAQTSKQPWIAAWGDKLAPGMQVIAVSRDLLELGLRRGTVVRIDGLDGQFVVLDKMNKRWRRKIDIYMALDVQGARNWGRRNVTIRWGREEHLEAARSLALAQVDTAPPASAVVVAEPETP